MRGLGTGIRGGTAHGVYGDHIVPLCVDYMGAGDK